jgi:hypothetical protein
MSKNVSDTVEEMLKVMDQLRADELTMDVYQHKILEKGLTDDERKKACDIYDEASIEHSDLKQKLKDLYLSLGRGA